MPIYEFRCKTCGHVSEFLMGTAGDTEIRTCKSCGGSALEKMISAASVSTHRRQPGHTCCGREERCSVPPCSSAGTCAR